MSVATERAHEIADARADGLVPLAEAAVAVGVDLGALNHAIERGELGRVLITGRRWVNADDVREWAQRSRAAGVEWHALPPELVADYANRAAAFHVATCGPVSSREAFAAWWSVFARENECTALDCRVAVEAWNDLIRYARGGA